jgi:O-antigen/teichoic acid export membrane protein
MSFGMVLLLGLLNYLLRRNLALMLPEEDFGFLYSAMALVMLLMAFLDLGLGEAMTILISRSYVAKDIPKTKKLFTCFLYFRTALAIACFAGLAGASFWLKTTFFGYPGPTILLIGLFGLIISLSLESAMIESIGAIRAFGVQYSILNLKALLLCVSSAVLVPRFGLAAMVVAWPAVSLATTGLAALYLNRKKVASLGMFQEEHFAELKIVLSMSLWIAIARAGTSMMYYMDTLCLTWLRSLTDVAVYNVALALNQMVYSLMVLPIILTPTVSVLWDDKDYREIRRIVLHIIYFCLLMLPVVLLVGLFWAGDLITIMFAGKYAAGATSLVWLWGGMIFFAIGNVCTRTLNAGHAHRSVAGLVIICVAANFLLNILLIPRYGGAGAAAATSMSYVLLAVISSIKLFSRLGALQSRGVKPSVRRED